MGTLGDQYVKIYIQVPRQRSSTVGYQAIVKQQVDAGNKGDPQDADGRVKWFGGEETAKDMVGSQEKELSLRHSNP